MWISRSIQRRWRTRKAIWGGRLKIGTLFGSPASFCAAFCGHQSGLLHELPPCMPGYGVSRPFDHGANFVG